MTGNDNNSNGGRALVVFVDGTPFSDPLAGSFPPQRNVSLEAVGSATLCSPFGSYHSGMDRFLKRLPPLLFRVCIAPRRLKRISFRLKRLLPLLFLSCINITQRHTSLEADRIPLEVDLAAAVFSCVL